MSMVPQVDNSPKLLVLTSNPPGNNGVGAILVKQILEHIPRENLRVLAFIQKPRMTESSESYSWVDQNLIRRYEAAYRPLKGWLGDIISLLAQTVVGRPHLSKLNDQCIAEGKEFECQGVLAVMDNPTVIRIAEKISKRLKVPLYSFVMDDPALQAKDFGFGPILTRQLQKAFDSAVTNSLRIAVAGEAMQDAYQKQYGKRGSILRQAVSHMPDRQAPKACSDSDRLIIGFAGSMTARDAYEQLIIELNRRHWMLAGKKVIFRIIGAYLKLIPSAPQHIEYYGWRSIPELIELSEECDFLYLPQSFSKDLHQFTALSFPNKLCTYLPARRPILLHTPDYGSLSRFFKEHNCGLVEHEFSPKGLLDEVERLVGDPVAYKTLQQGVESAFENVLNVESLKSEVVSFLGIKGKIH